MTITFDSREAFLAWRTQWRADYAELSKRIRQSKQSLKPTSPTYLEEAGELPENWNRFHQYPSENAYKGSIIQSRLSRLRVVARSMMETRMEIKRAHLESQRERKVA